MTVKTRKPLPELKPKHTTVSSDSKAESKSVNKTMCMEIAELTGLSIIVKPATKTEPASSKIFKGDKEIYFCDDKTIYRGLRRFLAGYLLGLEDGMDEE